MCSRVGPRVAHVQAPRAAWMGADFSRMPDRTDHSRLSIGPGGRLPGRRHAGLLNSLPRLHLVLLHAFPFNERASLDGIPPDGFLDDFAWSPEVCSGQWAATLQLPLPILGRQSATDRGCVKTPFGSSELG